MKNLLTIIPYKEIPKAVDVPLDNLVELFKIAVQMEQLCVSQNGIGLAAVQCGIPWRFFIINRDGKFEYYINCEYVGKGNKSKSIEGCLSLRNKDGNLRQFEVERFTDVIVYGKQLKVIDGVLVLEDFVRIEKDLFAIVFQHEIDHAADILISNIGKEIILI